jgi:hypothetical protein
MELVRVVQVSAIELDGVAVTGYAEGATIRHLEFRDHAGHLVVIERGDYGNGLTIFVRPEPATETRSKPPSKESD